jgi:uncharacterized protein involved in exopolysaccharide biosynthesis
MSERTPQQAEQLISLHDIWLFIAPLKWMLVVGAFCGAVLGWGSSWLFQPIYRAAVTMLPTKSPESNNGSGGIAGPVGGLAALAGINLQSGDNQVGAAEYLRSKTLVMKFIDTHDLMRILYAGRWDATKREWIPNWRGRVPTESSAVRRIRAGVIKISEDKKNGLLTVEAEWRDPALAYRWANDFVSLANDGLRRRAILDAQATIDYLNGQLEKTQTFEVKAALARIIETQLKNLTLAQVREDYAFRVVDAAVLPDQDDMVSPKRSIFAIVGLFFGAGLFGWLKLRSLTPPVNRKR